MGESSPALFQYENWLSGKEDDEFSKNVGVKKLCHEKKSSRDLSNEPPRCEFLIRSILSHDHQLLTNSLQSHNYLHASIEVLIFGVQVL